MSFVETGLEPLDVLLGGGLPRGALVQVFGEKAVGKSILVSQIAYKNLDSSENSLIIDTEQGFRNTIGSYWHERFQKRFGREADVKYPSIRRYAVKGRERRVSESDVKSAIEAALSTLKINYTKVQLDQACWTFLPEVELEYSVTDDPTVYVIEAPNLHDLLSLHGVRCDLLISESGRVEVRLLPGTSFNAVESPLGKLIREAKVSLISYDSLSMPLKSTFIGTQDFPGRSAATALILGQAQKLCSSLNVCFVALNHVTTNPITGQDKPYGGQIVGYDFKFSFLLEKAYHSLVEDKTVRNSKILQDANRVLRVHRHPSLAERSASIALKLAEEGFSA
ncbi:MAG: ATPase domain-containing protein [Nitrososphaeria archaeon]